MRVPRERRIGGAGLALCLLVVAGCGDAGLPSTPASLASPSPARSASPVPSTPAEATAPISPGLPSSVPGVDVVMDPALLQVLPAAIGTAEVRVEPESFGEAVRDPSFVASVDAAVFAIVAEGEDWATGVVAHLRPDVYSEAFFRDWRDTFDEGACAQADGVSARAEVGLADDRTMYVTTCSASLRSYHVYVAEREVVVSLFSLGERRFGEQLIIGIRP